MKMRKNIAIATLTASSLFVVSSCTKDFDEINKNPNGPVEVPSSLLISGIVENVMDQSYSTFNGGDMGSAWAQHWAKVQYNDEERYSPRDTQFDAIWNSFYAGSALPGGGGLQDINVMYDQAGTEGNTHVQGVALVLKAYHFSVLTDLFGDIPFSQALKAKEGINLPAYDTQADVYTGVLAMLDEANALLEDGEGIINATSDILYAGDVLKWQKFANALKFRTLMRMSNRADFNKQADLQAVLARPIFESNADEAKLVYLAAAPNNNPVNNSVILGNRGEYKVNSVIVDMMLDSNDPRLSKIAQPNKDGDYRGKPAGILDVPSDDYNYDNVSPIGAIYLAGNAPAYFMSYAEQEFLIAEAAKRGLLGVANDDATATTHFNNGVNASMSSNGVAAAAATTYLADHPYNASTALTQIYTEKWIALFGQGFEAWTEWRRTKVPTLVPALEGTINEIPSRYQYPPTEQALNGVNYEAAVAVQGADLLTTEVWWMK